jgi:hypothetical protein
LVRYPARSALVHPRRSDHLGFYLITQKNSFQSPGPWVDGVEARAGVDVDGNGSIDTSTGWQTIREQYTFTSNFIRVVTLTPARLDLSSLPAGYGFQFEFRGDDTVVANVSPIMDPRHS